MSEINTADKTCMKGVSIRNLRADDLDFVYAMVTTEQWNDRKDDLKRMLEYEPDGCFIAEVNNKAAGHVFTVSYGKLGWIGLLIVKPKYRRIGIGRVLTEKAKQYLMSVGTTTIKLEAVPEISQLYRNMGFVGEYDSFRFKGVYTTHQTLEDRHVTLMEEEMIKEIAEFDAQYFGAERTRVLSSLYQADPTLCLVSSQQSRIRGYIMCRKAETGYKLGPWVCAPCSKRTAEALFTGCLQRIEPKASVFVGVPAANKEAVEILQAHGFAQYSKSIRMRLGGRLQGECINGVFAIGGPMKG